MTLNTLADRFGVVGLLSFKARLSVCRLHLVAFLLPVLALVFPCTTQAMSVKPRVYYDEDTNTWGASCYGPATQASNNYDDVTSAWNQRKANWDLQNSRFLEYRCISSKLNIPVTIFESVVPGAGQQTFLNGSLLTWDSLYHEETYDAGTLQRIGVGPQQRSGYKTGKYECPKGLSWTLLPNSTSTNILAVCTKVDDVVCRECSFGNPVAPGKGVKTQYETDYRGAGDFPLEYQRQYSSSANGWQSKDEGVIVDGGSSGQRAGGVGCYPGVGSVTNEPYCYEYVVNPQEVVLFRGAGEAVSFDSQNGLSSAANPSQRLLKLTDAAGVVTGWQARDMDRLTFDSLDNTGRVRERMHITGKRHTYAYSDASTPVGVAPTSGLLVGITDTFGRLLQFTYDTQRRKTSMRDPAQKLYQYGYQPISRVFGGPAGNLASVLYPDSSQKGYLYNETAFTNGTDMPTMLTGIVDEANKRYATFKYKDAGVGAGPVAISTEHAGGVEKYQFTQATPAMNRQTVMTDPLGASQTINYQQIGNYLYPTSRSQQAGMGCGASTSAAAYDAKGNPISLDDFNGNRVCRVYDLTRNSETTKVEGLSKTVACSGVTTSGAVLPAGARKMSSTWHPDWNVKTRQAEPGKITTWIFNGQPDPFNGNAVASCAPATAILPDGKPIVVLCKKVEQATTDPDGAQGFAASLQPGVSARSWAYTYNEFGQVLTETDPRSFTTNYAYYSDTDASHTKGDLQRITDALGNATQFTQYNAHGQVLRSLDPNGLISEFSYDDRLRLTSTMVGGRNTFNEYYPTGLLRKVTRPDGSSAEYSYDDAHRLIGAADSMGRIAAYTLDNAGNRIREKLTDASGRLAADTTRVFDILGRLQQESAGGDAGNGGTGVDAYADKVTLLLHMDGPTGGTTFTDSSSRNKIPDRIVDPVKTDAANAKFGLGAGNFTGGYLRYGASPDFDMGASDFAAEVWAKFNSDSVGSRAFLFGHADSSGGNGAFSLAKTTGDMLSISLTTDSGVYSATGTTKALPNVWYHLALVRFGNTLSLYRNGVLELSTPVSGAVPARTSRFGVGVIGDYDYTYGGMYGARMMGWLDDFRLTKGVARYTVPFTPPAAPLPNDSSGQTRY